MLYNLIVINAEAGINICTLQLAEEGITEDDGQLASGMVKAIRDILEELKVGEIKNFETHQRQVLMYKKDAILTALICDQEDNIEIYNPKIQKITEMFNNVIDWNSWGGEMDIFEETIKKAKKMITLSNDEILNLLEEKLNQLLVQNSEILGYKIIFNSKVVSEEKLDDIEDFEIKSLLDSNFYNMIKNSLQELEISFVKDILWQILFIFSK